MGEGKAKGGPGWDKRNKVVTLLGAFLVTYKNMEAAFGNLRKFGNSPKSSLGGESELPFQLWLVQLSSILSVWYKFIMS